MAGTEYAGQCFCGNDISSSPNLGRRNVICLVLGERGEMCGGGGTLSVYEKSATGVGMKKRGSSVVRGLKGHGGHGKRKVGDP